MDESPTPGHCSRSLVVHHPAARQTSALLPSSPPSLHSPLPPDPSRQLESLLKFRSLGLLCFGPLRCGANQVPAIRKWYWDPFCLTQTRPSQALFSPCRDGENLCIFEIVVMPWSRRCERSRRHHKRHAHAWGVRDVRDGPEGCAA